MATQAIDIIGLFEKRVLVRQTLKDLDPNKTDDMPLITAKIVRDIGKRGWLKAKDVEEFAIFYQEGEFHLMTKDSVGAVQARYGITDKAARGLLKYMDSKYLRFRGDQH